ncbi:MAG: DNA polymerase/3'-5' exonuclease PolX [candidate division FCPU426 bacterium]
MPLTNQEIAERFERTAVLLELQDANPFRIRAYQSAAQTIANLPHNLAELAEAADGLQGLPGIGADLADKIRELLRSGTFGLLAELEAKTPAVQLAMLKLPGLGPKRVRQLAQSLKPDSLEDLKRAAENRRIRALPGFGPKLEEQILAGIAQREANPERTLWAMAEPAVEALLVYLRATPGVEEATAAGSFRRRKETVGDVDILLTSRAAEKPLDFFGPYPDIARVQAEGPTRATVILRSGLQVDVRAVPAESYGAALHYFTGSQAHNIAVRKLAQKKGYKLNEYGLFKGSRRIAGKNEEEIFRRLGLVYVEPELREASGELEAAVSGSLPRLVSLPDLRGDLHCHTDETDGTAGLLEMAEAAQALGYAYLGITDHSQHVTVARGLDARRLRKQLEAIDAANARLKHFTLFKGLEVDILEDGRLDLPDEVLDDLDYTVGSVHFKFNLPAERQTERILRAMDNPHFTILGHPTGRLLNNRPPYPLDLERVVAGAKERGCFLELNSHPERLDLNDVHCRLAKEAEVRVAVSSDAHSPVGLRSLRFGVNQARRGWLEPADVLNTRSVAELRKLFRRK